MVSPVESETRCRWKACGVSTMASYTRSDADNATDGGDNTAKAASRDFPSPPGVIRSRPFPAVDAFPGAGGGSSVARSAGCGQTVPPPVVPSPDRRQAEEHRAGNESLRKVDLRLTQLHQKK